MAQKTYTITDFNQQSSWVTAYNGSSYYFSSDPTTDTDDKTITLSDIPTGSTINSAYIEATHNSPSTGSAIRSTAFKLGSGSYSTATGWDDTTNPFTEPIPVAYLAPGETTTIQFKFKANGSLSSSGSFSSTLSFTNITVYVDYTEPTSSWLRVSGAWKRGEPWVKVSGVWKKGEMWTKVGGVWKKGRY